MEQTNRNYACLHHLPKIISSIGFEFARATETISLSSPKVEFARMMETISVSRICIMIYDHTTCVSWKYHSQLILSKPLTIIMITCLQSTGLNIILQ